MSHAREPHAGPHGCIYTIRVGGHFGPRLRQALAPLEALDAPGGVTVLTGPLPDQAALFGVLRRIETSGVTLLSIVRDEA